MILRESLKILNTTIRGDIYATLSTRPEKFIGDPQVWEKATEALRGALERAGLSYEIKAGEGAFYGPKIDIDVEDSLGRRWQCTTVQLDFFLPERLGLEYVDSDGSKKRPIMIHRAILGSIERFIGILLEHYNWRLPFWLSPIQVAVLPVSTRNLKYAEQAKNRLEAEGIRTELMAEGTLEKRVRSAHQSRASFMMIVGDEEERSGTCSLRDYRGHTARGLSLEKVVVWLKNLYKERVKNVGEIDESLSRLTQ
jgi:threonyl-tRNA synthetase